MSFSNTELTIESVVTRHRRQFRNCSCCHCQNHNKYIQTYGKAQETTTDMVVKTLPSPTDELNGFHLENSQTSRGNNVSLLSSKSSNFNSIRKEQRDQNNFGCCPDNMNGKENYLCLNKKYLNYLQNCSSTKGNKKFLPAKENFIKSLSNFSGILYRYLCIRIK